MIKKTSKITALLVAAATMVSLVPASASEVKKIDSEDGVIYNAIAYKDGIAVINGEVDDNDGTYYYADGKYNELDDVDDDDSYSAYSDKYVRIGDDEDASDNDYVNLEDGSVTDDLDEEDDASSALRKHIKDSDRYADSSAYDGYTADDDNADLTLIPGNKFGDSWYAGKYLLDIGGEYSTTTEAGCALTVSGAGYTNIYTDMKGNYIDADYNLGKIKVKTTDHSATIENSIDTEDLDSSTNVVSAKITKANVLGQDKDNIYRYAEITVTLKNGAAFGKVKINGKNFKVTANGSDGIVVLPVIQKISKTQDSDEIDDGKYSKTVYDYVISEDDEDSTSDVMKLTTDLSGDQKDYYELASDTDTDSNDEPIVKATVIGGRLVLYKVNQNDDDDNVIVQAAKLTSKNGYYYTDVEEQSTETAEFDDDNEKTAFDTDIDGNLYMIDGGNVKKFDGTDDWNKIYKVDGSMSALSVYDEDNMVVWDQDDEAYSLIGSKSTDTETDPTTTPAETQVVSTGWVQATDGTWSYVNADGTKAIGWLQDPANGTWYYLKTNGVMATGWLQDPSNGTWYYLAGSGAMQTGWINDNGTWYYCNASGAMLANTTVDGYKLAASGAWIK